MVADKIAGLVDDLELFDEDIDKYEYVIDLGKRLKPLVPEFQKDEFLVQGCSSKVWLVPEFKNGILELRADSNSVIVKGLVSILVSIFQGETPQHILDYDIKGLEVLGLSEIVSPTRQNGVFHMIEKIRHYADVYGG